MQRNPAALANGRFDVLVVGGGIHGACVARDAARRGLSVALVDRGDFGAETSHNCFKLLHGGVRYLQHLQFGRMRQSLLERRAWLRTAPHLTSVLRFVTPTHGRAARSAAAFSAAFKVHELVGFDRNAGLAPERHIPKARTIGRSEAARELPWLEGSGMNGAAVWFDGQMEDANRLVLECILDAVEHGAEAANYVRAEQLLEENDRVVGIRARDSQSGDEFEIRARITINAAGPWAAELLAAGGKKVDQPSALVKNMNLVISKLATDDAIGFYSRRAGDAVVGKSSRLYFVIPWAGVSIVGTSHFAFEGKPGDTLFTEDEILEFMDEVSTALPGSTLSRDDVLYCHAGLTPGDEKPGTSGSRLRRSSVGGHATGLLEITGVKYTTARAVAEAAVDAAAARLGAGTRPCSTAVAPLPGARGFESVDALVGEAKDRLTERHLPVPDALELERFARSYGSRLRGVLAETDAEGGDPSVLACRVRFAARHEMAVRLQDLVLRRLDRVERGVLTRREFDACALAMAKEHGWSAREIREQTADAKRQMRRHLAALGRDDPGSAGSENAGHAALAVEVNQ